MIFQTTHQSPTSYARTGKLSLNGVELATPVFMPVATRGAIKALSSEDLEQLDYSLILANTYHLYLRPGTEILDSFAGLKNMMSYPRALLTDSGGFQIFSLKGLFKFFRDGVTFRSHIDGSAHTFTPEKVIDIQRSIGSDIMMVLDDCPPYGASRERLEDSLRRTHEWAQKSVDHWQQNTNQQHLFGISQGGVDLGLRIKSLSFINELPFSGVAIGGLSVGEPRTEFIRVLEALAPCLDRKRPRYLMGVGTVVDILDGVRNGIDMFDCVLPTRNARNGQVFTSYGKVNLRNACHKMQQKPIDENCPCKVCSKYSLGYIRHLHKVSEMLAYSLSTYHNLFFMQDFMSKIRTAITDNYFEDFSNHWKKLYIP